MYLSVLTWNTWRPPISGRDKYKRGKRLVSEIESVDPDIVLLQEVFIVPDRRNLLERLDRYHKPMNVYDERSLFGVMVNATGGLATLSKYPILSSDFRPFISNGSGLAEWFSQKGYTKTVIATPEGELRVVNLHTCSMSWNGSIRSRQLRQVVEDPEIATDEMPVILAGDFNFDMSKGNGVSGPEEFKVLMDAGFDDGLEGRRSDLKTFCEENRYTTSGDITDLGGSAMIDGIFYKSGRGKVVTNTGSRLVGEEIEASDHSGVQSNLRIESVGYGCPKR